MNPYTEEYQNNMKQIEPKWNNLLNLGNFSGVQATEFETLCLTNIDQYKKMRDYELTHSTYTVSMRVPAYICLALLYENQEEYLLGRNICKEGMDLEADIDHTLEKTRRRLEKKIKKSGMANVSQVEGMVLNVFRRKKT